MTRHSVAAVATLVLLGSCAARGSCPARAEESPTASVAVSPARATPLFNGKDLSGWTADVPARAADAAAPASFVVRDGLLVSLGTPPGHLLTDANYRDYRLDVEYRFPGKVVTAARWSTPRSHGRSTRCSRSRSRSR